MTHKGWLIYSEHDAKENASYIEWFKEEAMKQGLTLELILREALTIGIVANQRTVLYKDQQIGMPSFAVVRTIEPLLNLHLETCGVLVFNSSRVAYICNHKAVTHHHIHRLGIPMLDTLFIKKENLTEIPPLSFPFIIKEATGRGGKQVYFISDVVDWRSVHSQIKTQDLVIQSCNVKLGKDVRVFVVGKEIVGAVMRESSTDFRANFKLGGSVKWYPLNERETKVVHKIIQNFHFGFVGIDFLIGENDEFLFNEIEDVVGSRALSQVSEINILQKYVTHIKEKLKKRNFT